MLHDARDYPAKKVLRKCKEQSRVDLSFEALGVSPSVYVRHSGENYDP